MLIVARVNGYYSPYSPQTIMEEEAKCRYGDVFTLAEKKFFKHRLVTLYPKISDEGMKTSITFLEQQKLDNCPCFVHIEQRGFGWIVFKRQPDNISSNLDGIPEIEDDDTDDKEFYSSETDNSMVTPSLGDDLAIPNDDASGAATENNLLSSTDPQESVSLCESSLHSRDNPTKHSINQRNDQKEENGNNKNAPMDFDDRNKADGAGGENNRPDDKTEGKPRRISRGHYYNPLVYCNRHKGKTYYYQYFKPYSYDFRMLQNDEKGDPIECLCPRGKVHFTTCPWYNPDIIYILDTKGDLSTSEQAAQQKIYQMYHKTLNNPPESCGCGTAAERAYMGHNTGCIEFLHLHER